MCSIITDTDTDLKRAAEHIQHGSLVAFPTETVYGLGARLDDVSLAKIFAAKHRPYSDPLICHFDTPEHAKKYVTLTDEESLLFDKLAQAFWPGPLTIIAPSTPAVPPLVMAGTGCVGVRVPSHPVAHKFLEFCGEPVAAPSANLFGHVSPTTVEHVENDLGKTDDLLIISGGKATIGIESTVIRIIGNTITILRPGFITAGQLETVSPGNVKAICADSQKLASPGHETRHYAPNLVTVLAKAGTDGKPIPANAVIIDFHRMFASVSSSVLRYFDMSPVGSVQEAISRIYDILREAETTAGAEICLIADIEKSGQDGNEHDQELVGSLRDRLLRSASHQMDTFRLM